MVKKGGESYSRQDVVLQILIYLYNKGVGKSPTDIQERCSNHTLEYKYVNKILVELWNLKTIDREEISEHRITYRINNKGREIVNVSKGGLLKDVYFKRVDFDRF